MKCSIKQQNTLICPKCKSKIKRNNRGFQCKRCGYSQFETESNQEKKIYGLAWW